MNRPGKLTTEQRQQLAKEREEFFANWQNMSDRERHEATEKFIHRVNEERMKNMTDAERATFEKHLGAAIALSTQLREDGIRVQLYTEQKKFKAKMQYADRLGIPYVIFLGEDEIAQNKCSVKELATGQQQTLTAAEAAALITRGLSERNLGCVIKENN